MDSATLNTALIARFPRPETEEPTLDRSRLLNCLRAGGLNPITTQSLIQGISELESGTALTQEDYAIIAFLDFCCSEAIDKAELPEDVSRKLLSVVYSVAYVAIDEGILALYRHHSMLLFLDRLFDFTIGWRDLEGKTRLSFEDKFEQSLIGLQLLNRDPSTDPKFIRARNSLVELLQRDINKFTDIERQRIAKLEKRLIDAEAGQIRTTRSRILAAQMLNGKMKGMVLSKPIVKFLHGHWFDSLQLILNRQGVKSDAWHTSTKLTETLIRTFQPKRKDADAKLEEEDVSRLQTQDLYRIIENIPEQLNKSMVSLEYNSALADQVLAVIETEHVKVMKEELQDSEFELLNIDAGLIDTNTSISQSLIAPVMALEPDQWFVYTIDGKPSHIKLTLKDCELNQLLFTNANGLKVLQVSFEEFAYLMGSDTANKILDQKNLSESLRFQLTKLAKSQVKKIRNEEKEKKRLAAVKVRKKENDLVADEYVLVAVRKDQLAPNQSTPNPEQAMAIASQLNFGATLKLYNEGSIPVEAKLLVDDPDEDKIIFVDRGGNNLGEFTKKQIVELISDGKCELLENGLKENDSFRMVVDRMRNKKPLGAES